MGVRIRDVTVKVVERRCGLGLVAGYLRDQRRGYIYILGSVFLVLCMCAHSVFARVPYVLQMFRVLFYT